MEVQEVKALSPLFRAEARHPRAVSAQGEILLIRPVSLGVLTGAGCGIALLLVVFLLCGTYTRRTTLRGQIVPHVGVIKIFSPLPGVIVEKRVVEGQPVRRGDTLYVVSSELRSSELGDSQALVSERVETRRRSFLGEIGISERSARAREKYAELGAKGYLSSDQLLERESSLLDQQMRLQTLERDRIVLRRQISEQRVLLNDQSARFERDVAGLQRSVASTEQELMQNEARRKLAITAPFDGVATTVLGSLGQYVDAARPLLSVLPRDSALEAHLYAPSSAVGFIKPGDTVFLRYDAFPYQKFGRYRGTVRSVSMSASPAIDFAGAGAGALGGANPASEPLYLVTVALQAKAVRAYGTDLPLRAGMLANADVMHETRRLYEWVLEPLTTLTGKVR
jgi:membrane fusion protein